MNNATAMAGTGSSSLGQISMSAVGSATLVIVLSGLAIIAFFVQLVLLIVRDGLMLAGSALMLFHYHEKPSIMRGGKLANFTLVCGIQFFIINVRVVAWPVYVAGATLYVVTGFRYIWRELLRWKRSRPTSAAVS